MRGQLAGPWWTLVDLGGPWWTGMRCCEEGQLGVLDWLTGRQAVMSKMCEMAGRQAGWGCRAKAGVLQGAVLGEPLGQG